MAFDQKQTRKRRKIYEKIKNDCEEYWSKGLGIVQTLEFLFEDGGKFSS